MAPPRCFSCNPRGLSKRTFCQSAQPDELWTVCFKRSDGVAYDALSDVDPRQSVAQLKQRLLDHEALRLSRSLVALRLVRRAAGPPSDDEEQAAQRSADAVLRDPTATLHEAGLGPVSWLLLEFAAAAGAAPHVGLTCGAGRSRSAR